MTLPPVASAASPGVARGEEPREVEEGLERRRHRAQLELRGPRRAARLLQQSVDIITSTAHSEARIVRGYDVDGPARRCPWGSTARAP